MSEHKEKPETVPVVGASGSIGILPGGFFAEILSNASQEPSASTSQSQQDPAQRC